MASKTAIMKAVIALGILAIILIIFYYFSSKEFYDNFTLFSSKSLVFIVPYIITLCTFGIKENNLLVSKYSIICISIIGVSVLVNKFSFFLSSQIFFIQSFLLFLIILFTLPLLFEYEMYIDSKKERNMEAKKIEAFLVMNNNDFTLETLLILNDIKTSFEIEILNLEFFIKYNYFLFKVKRIGSTYKKGRKFYKYFLDRKKKQNKKKRYIREKYKLLKDYKKYNYKINQILTNSTF